MIGRSRKEEKTGFQESRPYNSKIDLQTDFVMAYGIGEDMPQRIRVWKEKGYVVHLMTGVSWGEYQDYLNGKIDGRAHFDEAQKNSENDNIIHGTSVDIPYMVPTISYSDFLTDQIRVAVDAGVEAIHLEEPEFWVEGGYSDAFKREWEIYYKENWKAPHESVDGQYRASKLKAYLYTRCLDRLCSTLKEYAKVKYNRNLRFYVPTHSLINYTQWGIVSPESRLLDLPSVDGYIAQIWTGTARTPNVYQGVRKERTFETAFLEYGIMQELVRGTGRNMWFLHDPIEDNPEYSWKEYQRDYFKIVVASLLHPNVSNYEICPWPNRVFNGFYPKESENGTETEGIPDDYATILLTIMHTLENMDQKEIFWDNSNTEMGILLADSAMYQRKYPSINNGEKNIKYDGTSKDLDEGLSFSEMIDWSSFYGLALPLLKSGIPIKPVQLDNVRRFSGYLDDYRVLILSYEFMKPEYPDLHNAIAEWVKNGGALIYVGDGSDAFHNVREWWNQGKRRYSNPAEHLFECLGLIDNIEPGVYKVGKGVLGFMKVHPSKCAYSALYANQLRDTVKNVVDTLEDKAIKMITSNAFVLRRGPYVIASVMEECVCDKPTELKGHFVNLFAASLPVINKVNLKPGEQILLYDITKIKDSLALIAASSRIESLDAKDNGFEFIARGPEGVKAVARFYCEKKPINTKAREVKSSKAISVDFIWDEKSSTVLFNYSNYPDGIVVQVEW